MVIQGFAHHGVCKSGDLFASRHRFAAIVTMRAAIYPMVVGIFFINRVWRYSIGHA